jgi:Flp pilus assembly pilin Flp
VSVDWTCWRERCHHLPRNQGLQMLSTIGIIVNAPFRQTGGIVVAQASGAPTVARTEAQRLIRALEEMMPFVNLVRRFIGADDGQDLLEYALLVALIALVAFGAIQLAGTSVNNIFNNIASQLNAAS